MGRRGTWYLQKVAEWRDVLRTMPSRYQEEGAGIGTERRQACLKALAVLRSPSYVWSFAKNNSLYHC